MPHRPSPADQGISNQRPVAAPGNGFGAHDGGWQTLSYRYEPVQRIPEFQGLHVICVPPETLVSPSPIHRTGPAFPPPTQTRHVPILKSGLSQTLGQRFLVVLRIAPGKRNRPYIRQELNPFRLEEVDEFLNWPRRMTNGPEL